MSPEIHHAALARERETRKAAYFAAVAARDALPTDARLGERRLAENVVGAALYSMKFWNDPIPAAPAATIIAPVATPTPVSRSGAVKPEPTKGTIYMTGNTLLAERQRTKTIIAEGARLGVTREAVGAAISGGMSADAFTKEYDLAARVADRIVAAAKAAGL